MRKFANVVVLSLAMAGLFTIQAHADPQRSGGRGTVFVNPSTDLNDEQTVQVSGTGFKANTTVQIVECSEFQSGSRDSQPGGYWVCDYGKTWVQTTADSAGDFGPVAVHVYRNLEGFYRRGHTDTPVTHTCAQTDDCAIWANSSAHTHIGFAN